VRALPEAERLATVLAAARRTALIGPGFGGEQIRRLSRLLVANRRALELYEPSPYDGRVVQLRAASRVPGSSDDPAMGWGGLARAGVETLTIPGDHETLIRSPHAQVLAQRLEEILASLGL